MTCPDCKGSGQITLLLSVVPCETCFAQRTAALLPMPLAVLNDKDIEARLYDAAAALLPAPAPSAWETCDLLAQTLESRGWGDLRGMSLEQLCRLCVRRSAPAGRLPACLVAAAEGVLRTLESAPEIPPENLAILADAARRAAPRPAPCVDLRTDTGTMITTIPLPHDWMQRAASGQPTVPAPLNEDDIAARLAVLEHALALCGLHLPVWAPRENRRRLRYVCMLCLAERSLPSSTRALARATSNALDAEDVSCAF